MLEKESCKKLHAGSCLQEAAVFLARSLQEAAVFLARSLQEAAVFLARSCSVSCKKLQCFLQEACKKLQCFLQEVLQEIAIASSCKILARILTGCDLARILLSCKFLQKSCKFVLHETCKFCKKRARKRTYLLHFLQECKSFLRSCKNFCKIVSDTCKLCLQD